MSAPDDRRIDALWHLADKETPLLYRRRRQETARLASRRAGDVPTTSHADHAVTLRPVPTMATEAMGSMTPPPPSSRVQTPPAPRHGFQDSWEPYSPRKSARISSQRTANRTPSPHTSRSRQQPSSPRTAKKAINTRSDAAMVSPVPSPRKKPHPTVESSRQVSGTLTAEGTANAAAALGLGHAKDALRAPTTSISRATGMLPTPSKTPQKPPNEKTAAHIQTFARNLFASDEEPMPSPRKRRAKRYTGVTMESFTAEDAEDPIQIFTDSQDRIPQKDDSAENPFYGAEAAPAEPPKRKSKRRMVQIPGEGAQSVDEASRREDGMIYVFRGKKFFRKFAENESADTEEEDATGADVEPELVRPLTRSSVKPRLLFPSKKSDENDQDEEAVTDVEEDMFMSDEAAVPQTPQKSSAVHAKTPEAPKYAPVSPPDTRRTTRSTNKLAAETPMKKSGRKSPFDAWPRTKEGASSSAPKRQGDSLAGAATKRTRA
ncbi:base excision DNA repair protein [Purpureocillium lavendulum]|uniref:Base excision DNA repair protein n=1 Tax=Purpureocillium lavendulum TaxID=1247861 RepID=A0AB34FEB1_9HYPO|nr:base excision DNA repair protein [Purpureocillium lavendulum]